LIYEVFLTDAAQRDLENIDDYICSFDSARKADYVLDKIETALESLTELPLRGAHPKELLQLGIREYREIYFKPYRIIYRTEGQRVNVYLITDGRRDMQSLLSARLLGL